MYDEKIDELRDLLEDLEHKEFLAREGAQILMSQAQPQYALNALEYLQEIKERQYEVRRELDRLYLEQEREFKKHISALNAEYEQMIKGADTV